MIRMKVIKPVSFNRSAFDKELRQALAQTLALAEKELGKTTKTWNHKPEWEKKIGQHGTGLEGSYLTDDDIYRWVSGGTEGPYPIPKDGPGWLSFPSAYRAKTVPNLAYSRAGGPSGDKVTIFGQVMHPGIEARNFDKTVAKYVEPWFKKYTQEAMDRGAKASGHAI